MKSYVMKTRDACVMTISCWEVLNFHFSGSIRHKKAIETGKCCLSSYLE